LDCLERIYKIKSNITVAELIHWIPNITDPPKPRHNRKREENPIDPWKSKEPGRVLIVIIKEKREAQAKIWWNLGRLKSTMSCHDCRPKRKVPSKFDSPLEQ